MDKKKKNKDPMVNIEDDHIWKIIQSYFKNSNNFLTLNQLDSYNNFIDTLIPKTLRQFNPIQLDQIGGDNNENRLKTLKDDIEYKLKIKIMVGGKVLYTVKNINTDELICTSNYLSNEEGVITIPDKELPTTDLLIEEPVFINDGSKIFIGKPVIEQKDEDGNIFKKQLFPNEARLKNLTYSAMLYSDIVVSFERVNIDDLPLPAGIPLKLGKQDKPDFKNNMKISVYTYQNNESNKVIKIFKNVPLGRIPIMLHSNICSLNNQSFNNLREMGECPYGQGGYFVIKGKEKVIVAQERQMENKVFINKESGDSPYYYFGEIRSSPEYKLQPPRLTKIFLLKKKLVVRSSNIYKYLEDLYFRSGTFIAIGDIVSFNQSGLYQGIVKRKLNDDTYLVELLDLNITKVVFYKDIQYIDRKLSNKNLMIKRFYLVDVKDSNDEIIEKKGNSTISDCDEKRDQVSNKIIIYKTPEILKSRDSSIYCESNNKSKSISQLQSPDNIIRVTIPNIDLDVPVFILFKALGIDTDINIINYIVHDLDTNNKLHQKYLELLKPSLIEGLAINSQNKALTFIKCLMNKSNLSDHINNDSNKEDFVKIINILTNWFIPHISKNFIHKAYFLGYMVKKLLDSKLGLKTTTDRDSYLYKRVDISGYMMAQLFRDLYFRFRNSIRDKINTKCSSLARQNKGRINFEDEITLDTVQNFFDYKVIDDGLLYAFRNCWGMVNAPCKEGIVQDLNIISSFGTISNLRRINTPIPKSAKMRDPHSLHASSWGIMCPSETPDGGNVGIRKNLSMQARISFDCSSLPLETCLFDLGLLDITLLNPSTIGSSCIVFLNERMCGYTKNPKVFVENLKTYRRNGLINIYTSISWIISENLIKVSTESGRASRPLLIVNNGNLVLDNKWIERIDLDIYQILHSIDGIQEITEIEINKKDSLQFIEKINSGIIDDINDVITSLKELIILVDKDINNDIDKENITIKEITIDNRKPWNVLTSGYKRFFSRKKIYEKVGLNIYESLFNEQDSSYLKPILNIDELRENEGVIEFIDVTEENVSLIAMSRNDLYNYKKIYTGDILNGDTGHILKIDSKYSLLEKNDFINLYKKEKTNQKWKIQLLEQKTDNEFLIDLGTKSLDDGKYELYKINLTKQMKTHCEIHPCMILGIMASIIPFIGSNQAPRNQFSGAQTKQGIGIFATNYLDRMDTKSQVLLYPQAPIVDTRIGQYINTNKLPFGQNAIVAIACYSGYNQDDSIIINQSSLDRGLFRTIKYRTYTEEESQLPDGRKRYFCLPDASYVSNISSGDYTKLQKNGIYLGIVKEEKKVTENDVIIGVCISDGKKNTKQVEDDSLFIRKNEQGIVDKVYVGLDIEGNKFCKVRVRKEKIPELGDKFASRHGQKGVIGMKIVQNDMPTSENGIVPDMIINPQAFPKRMTLGQLIETITGKQSVLKGNFADATGFVDIPREEIAQSLEDEGFDRYGNEIMYNGMTGEQMNVTIFIGPTYYQRLYHQVDDKIYSRAGGSISTLSHQPVGGRALGGGLRIGEMERDGLLAHGVSSFLKESMMERSDKFNMWIDNKSGNTAIVNPAKNIYKSYGSYNTVEYLDDNNKMIEKKQIQVSESGMTKIDIPYSFKLLTQEMTTMSIMPRFITSNLVEEWKKDDSQKYLKLSGEYYESEVKDPFISKMLNPMTSFHNQIKSILISGSTTKPSGNSLIDFSCGRGGDIKKWYSSNINGENYLNNYGCQGGRIVGMDLFDKNIIFCKKRLETLKNSRNPKEKQWANTVKIDIFQRDTSFELFNITKKNITHRLANLFPRIDGVDRKKLKVSCEGKYSITRPPQSWDIINLIKLFLPDLNNLIITDASGSIGGDTIGFARYFKTVNTFEYNTHQFECLQNNVELYAKALNKKVNIIHNFSEIDYQNNINLIGKNRNSEGISGKIINTLFDEKDNIPSFKLDNVTGLKQGDLIELFNTQTKDTITTKVVYINTKKQIIYTKLLDINNLTLTNWSLKYTNIGDFNQNKNKVIQDVVFIDPPWGGVHYKSSSQEKLFNNINHYYNIEEILKNYSNQSLKLLIFKLPMSRYLNKIISIDNSYNLYVNKSKIPDWKVFQYDMYNFQILICIPKSNDHNSLYKQKNMSKKPYFITGSQVLDSMKPHIFDVATQMFSIHYYFDKLESIENLLSNVAKSLKYNGFFMVTCLDGDLVYNQLKDTNIIEGKVGNKLLWSIRKGENWDTNGYGEDLPDDNTGLGIKVNLLMKSISDQEISEYLVKPSLLLRLASKFGLSLARVDRVKDNFKFINTATGNFWDIYNNYEPKGVYSSLLEKKNQDLAKYTKLHRYYIFEYKQDIIYPNLTFSKKNEFYKNEDIETLQNCDNWRKKNLNRIGNRWSRKESSNYSKPLMKQFFYTVANQNQVDNDIINLRNYFGMNNKNKIELSGKNSYRNIENPELDKNVNSDLLKNIDSVSFENTLNYMFNHMRTGIYIRIKNNQLIIFRPFVNIDYTNQDSEELLKINPDKYTDLNDYYLKKQEKFKKNTEQLKDILPKDRWFYNDCIIGNVEDSQYWNDSFFIELKGMFEELLSTKKINDTEFFINKRDFPYLRDNKSEPYTSIYESFDKSLPPEFSNPNSKFTPILSFCSTKGYLDLPIPTPDDWKNVCENTTYPSNYTNCKFEESIKNTTWDNKLPIAVFRGSSTGCSITDTGNQRLRLAKMSYELNKRIESLDYNQDEMVYVINREYPKLVLINENYQLDYNDKTEGGIIIGIDYPSDLIVNINSDYSIIDLTDINNVNKIKVTKCKIIRKINGGFIGDYNNHLFMFFKEDILDKVDNDSIILDAKLTSWNSRDRKTDKYMKYIDTTNYNFNVGNNNKLDYIQQEKNKFIFYIDGWSAAYRYSSLMRFHSVILKINSNRGYYLWFFNYLNGLDILSLLNLSKNQPKNYLKYLSYLKVSSDHDHIIVPNDFNEKQLSNILKWCKDNDEICKKIASNCEKKYKELFTKSSIFDYLELLTYKISQNISIDDKFNNKLVPSINQPVESRNIYIPMDKLNIVRGRQGFNLKKIQMKNDITIRILNDRVSKNKKKYKVLELSGDKNKLIKLESEIYSLVDFDYTYITIPPHNYLMKFVKVNQQKDINNIKVPSTGWILEDISNIISNYDSELEQMVKKINLEGVLERLFSNHSMIKQTIRSNDQVTFNIYNCNLNCSGNNINCSYNIGILVSIDSDILTISIINLTDKIKMMEGKINTQYSCNINIEKEDKSVGDKIRIIGPKDNLNKVSQYINQLIYTFDIPTIDINQYFNPINTTLNFKKYLDVDMIKSKRIAIIVPYRNGTNDSNIKINRMEQQKKFSKHFKKFFKDSNIKYNIFYIHQNDTNSKPGNSNVQFFTKLDGNVVRKFNRGALINIGFDVIKQLNIYDTVIIHDIDLLPNKSMIDKYTDYPNNVRHLANKWSRYDIAGYQYFGGAISVNPEQLSLCNGYPNHHWGWGKEDLSFLIRLKQKNINIDECQNNISDYKDLEDISNLKQKIDLVKKYNNNGQGLNDIDFIYSSLNIFDNNEKSLQAISGLNQTDWYTINKINNIDQLDYNAIMIDATIGNKTNPYLYNYNSVFEEYQNKMNLQKNELEDVIQKKMTTDIDIDLFEKINYIDIVKDCLKIANYEKGISYNIRPSGKQTSLDTESNNIIFSCQNYQLDFIFENYDNWKDGQLQFLRFFKTISIINRLIRNVFINDNYDLIKEVLEKQKKNNKRSINTQYLNYQVYYNLINNNIDNSSRSEEREEELEEGEQLMDGSVHLDWYFNRREDPVNTDNFIDKIYKQTVNDNYFLTYQQNVISLLNNIQIKEVQSLLKKLNENFSDSQVHQDNKFIHPVSMNRSFVMYSFGNIYVTYNNIQDCSNLIRYNSLTNEYLMIDETDKEIFKISDNIWKIDSLDIDIDLCLLTLYWKQKNDTEYKINTQQTNEDDYVNIPDNENIAPVNIGLSGNYQSNVAQDPFSFNYLEDYKYPDFDTTNKSPKFQNQSMVGVTKEMTDSPVYAPSPETKDLSVGSPDYVDNQESINSPHFGTWLAQQQYTPLKSQQDNPISPKFEGAKGVDPNSPPYIPFKEDNNDDNNDDNNNDNNDDADDANNI